jgi:hypothetical protein
MLSRLDACDFIPKNENDYYINPEKPAIEPFIFGGLFNIWTYLREVYPQISIIYSYSNNGLDFAVFKNNFDDKHFIYFSHSHSTEVRVSVNGMPLNEQLRNCYITYKKDGDVNTRTRFFGHLFHLKNNQTCKIDGDTEMPNAIFEFSVSQDSMGWWNASANIKYK